MPVWFFLLPLAGGCGDAADAPASRPAMLLEAIRHPTADPFEGPAIEVLQASNYTYVHVQAGGEATWVVALSRAVNAGDIVRVVPFGELEDFASERTGRHFERLVFATLTVRSSP